MFENEKREQFIGFLVFFIIMGAAIYGVQALAADQQVAAEIKALNPWIGAHLKAAGMCVAALIFFVGATFPALSMFRRDGKLEVLGFISIRLLSAIAFPLLFFILGAVWYSGHR
jgi:uncharacterized membrane protein YhaH (DUF805 family)